MKQGSYHFMGVDPAPALGERSDDGVIVMARMSVRPELAVARVLQGLDAFSDQPMDWLSEYVYAYRCRKMSVRQWTGMIHKVNDRFSPEMICMDYNGGGTYIGLGLREARQLIDGVETAVTPIVSPAEPLPDARHTLCMFKRGDPCIEAVWPRLAGDELLVDAMHVAFQSALEHSVLFPEPWEERSNASREKLVNPASTELQWAAKMVSEGIRQLASITVLTDEAGAWITGRRGGRVFSATGKKDIAYAMIYAYVGFLAWLKRMAWLGEAAGNATAAEVW